METTKAILDRVLYWITVALFALLVVIVVWQVVSRQALNAPSTWTEEAARMTFVWLGLFAAALVFGERGHIAVEFVARKFADTSQRRLGIIVQAVVLGFAALIFVWGGWRVSMNAWTQNLSALPFTLGQMYLALPIAGLLIGFYSVYYIRALAREDIEAYPPVGIDDADAEATAVRGGDATAGSMLMSSAQSDTDVEGEPDPKRKSGKPARSGEPDEPDADKPEQEA